MHPEIRLGYISIQKSLEDKEKLLTFLIEKYPKRKDIVNERLGG